ncbi:Hypothetical protein LOCK900_2897 [Lacticaseibacillus rhamnosus LOCK900]|nr:Hypothetical protein LOCK900_2897 [Lacticaseibacillus rhamnosus LOCK900]EHJ35823.1 hypothetical protein HMPREF0541_00170 [Lacticaseibacillus rhamnosus ATCC 21052]
MSSILFFPPYFLSLRHGICQLLKIKVDFIDNIAYVNNYHIK